MKKAKCYMDLAYKKSNKMVKNAKGFNPVRSENVF